MTAEQDIQKFADNIRRQYHKAVDDVIEIGRTLVTAKNKLLSDEFERMFRDHERPIETPLPFGLRAAQMYMRVAQNKILTAANHGSSLPTSYRTLYELSRLDDKSLLAALSDGRIHAEMERHDAVRIRSAAKASAHKAMKAGRLAPRERADIQREIQATLRSLWTRFPQEHQFIVEEVQALAEGSLPNEQEQDEHGDADSDDVLTSSSPAAYADRGRSSSPPGCLDTADR